MNSLCPLYVYIYTVNNKKKNQSTYVQWLRMGKLRRARPSGWDSGGSRPPARVSGGPRVRGSGGPGVRASGGPGLGPAAGRSAFRSLLGARAARTALCHLWLVSCLGLVVSVTVQVSQQGVAIGQSIRGQQLPDVLHRLLISRFLLLQGPD